MFLYSYRYDKNGLYEMSDPNLEPPKTISYELGVSYDLYENTILTLSGYYKDVTGQTDEVNYINSNGTIDYDKWVNNNYEDIEGLEINLSKIDNTWLTGWINFNYLLKKSGVTGRATISNSTLNEEQVGLYEGEEDRFLPQPALNANITFRSPYDIFSENWLNHLVSGWSITIFASWRAGEYFTFDPFQRSGIMGRNITNNMQWPDYYMVDLRLNKTFYLFGFNTTFFLDISNVFNFKVNLLHRGYAFREEASDEGGFTGWDDTYNYLATLRLPEYGSSEYDELRDEENGLFIPGDDKIGELRSKDKPYINDPDYSYFIFGQPRDIWFGIKVDF
jgi:hypothetical protein